jgi:outer membrane protein assembly factor BamB
MKTKNRSLIVVFVFLIVFILLKACINSPAVRNAYVTAMSTPYANFPSYGPDETPFYNPTGASAFVPVINFKGIITWRYNWEQELTPNPFVIDGDHLLFAGHVQEPDRSENNVFSRLNSELLCININSGQVLWQDWIGNPNLIIDENHILYVPSTRDFVPPGLVAYDVVSGKKLWETLFPHDYGDIDVFFEFETEVFVSVHLGHGQYSSYIVDKKTGAIKQAFENKRRYAGSDAVISDGIALKRHYYGYGPVKAFRLGSENLLWGFHEPVVSNIAVDNSTVYFVTMSTQLIAVNLQTGKVLSRLNFSPKFDPNFDYYDKNYDSPFDFLNEPPTIAAGNGYVAVYFEDKRQLSVFRFVSGQ